MSRPFYKPRPGAPREIEVNEASCGCYSVSEVEITGMDVFKTWLIRKIIDHKCPKHNFGVNSIKKKLEKSNSCGKTGFDSTFKEQIIADLTCGCFSIKERLLDSSLNPVKVICDYRCYDHNEFLHIIKEKIRLGEKV